MWMNYNVNYLNESDLNKVIYDNFITTDEYNNGIKFDGKIYPYNQLSKEFRLKKSVINDG